MKVTKRILAVVLTVLMLAMLVPVTASALDGVPTTGYKVTINGKKGFTATVYKIADFDTTTGAFSNFLRTVLWTRHAACIRARGSIHSIQWV